MDQLIQTQLRINIDEGKLHVPESACHDLDSRGGGKRRALDLPRLGMRPRGIEKAGAGKGSPTRGNATTQWRSFFPGGMINRQPVDFAHFIGTS